MRKVALLAAVALVGLSVSGAKADTITYNAANDFSPSSNPNGVWSYTNGSSPLTNTAVFGGVMNAWYGPNTNGTTSSVTADISPVYTTYSTKELDPNYLSLDPQTGLVAVQFTAPEAGLADISAAFAVGDSAYNASGTNVSILAGNMSAFAHIDSSNSSQYLYLPEMLLTAGEIVTFEVASNGDYNDLSTQVNAQVDFTPVPEPMSLTALASGLIGLGAVRRRRKAA